MNGNARSLQNNVADRIIIASGSGGKQEAGKSVRQTSHKGISFSMARMGLVSQLDSIYVVMSMHHLEKSHLHLKSAVIKAVVATVLSIVIVDHYHLLEAYDSYPPLEMVLVVLFACLWTLVK